MPGRGVMLLAADSPAPSVSGSAISSSSHAHAGQIEDSSAWLDGVLGTSLEQLLNSPSEFEKLNLQSLPIPGTEVRPMLPKADACASGVEHVGASGCRLHATDDVASIPESPRHVATPTAALRPTASWRSGGQPRAPRQQTPQSTAQRRASNATPPSVVSVSPPWREFSEGGSSVAESSDENVDSTGEMVVGSWIVPRPSSSKQVPELSVVARLSNESPPPQLLRQPPNPPNPNSEAAVTVHYHAGEAPTEDITLSGGQGMHVLVDEVLEGSKAYRAGVRKGFALLRMNGRSEFRQLPGWQVRLLLEAPLVLDFDASPLVPTASRVTEIRLTFSPREAFGMPTDEPIFGPDDSGLIVEEVNFRKGYCRQRANGDVELKPNIVSLNGSIATATLVHDLTANRRTSTSHYDPSSFGQPLALGLAVTDSSYPSTALRTTLCVSNAAVLACGVEECLAEDSDEMMEIEAPEYPELHVASDPAMWPQHWKGALLANGVAHTAATEGSSTATPGRSETSTNEHMYLQDEYLTPDRISFPSHRFSPSFGTVPFRASLASLSAASLAHDEDWPPGLPAPGLLEKLARAAREVASGDGDRQRNWRPPPARASTWAKLKMSLEPRVEQCSQMRDSLPTDSADSAPSLPLECPPAQTARPVCPSDIIAQMPLGGANLDFVSLERRRAWESAWFVPECTTHPAPARSKSSIPA